MANWKWNGKWVLVAGTGTEEGMSAEVRAASQALGEQLAAGGYGLITGGWPGVDHRTAVAYVGRLRELGADPASHFKQIVMRGRALLLEEGTLVFVETGTREYTESVKHADALVLVGGVGGTFEVYEVAKLRRIPLFPLAATGGDARRAFADLAQTWQQESDVYGGLTLAQLTELDAPGDGAVIAAMRGLGLALHPPGVVPPATASEVSGPAEKENEAALQKLLAAFRDSGVMGFVGAGSSVRAGYPSWMRLLELMDERLEGGRSNEELLRIRGEADLLVRAGAYRQLFGTRDYSAFVRDTFGPHAGDAERFHKDLVGLPFRHVLTTNYDDLLERAHVKVFAELPERVEIQNPSDMQDFLARARSRKQVRRYVYLHGRYNNPAELILTEEDYQRRYLQSGNAETLLTALFASYQFLFVGFSLTDLDLMSIFRRVVAQLQIEEAPHFALMPLYPSDDPIAVRRRLDSKYKIEPIFYPVTKDHGRLHDLVRRLGELLQPADDLPAEERKLLLEIVRREAAGSPYRLADDFEREKPMHVVLRALRKRGFIRPIAGGTWQPRSQVEITPLGKYEIERRKIE